MSAMIERVAAALAGLDRNETVVFEDLSFGDRPEYCWRAKRVIEAMREPTDEMRDAGRVELRNNRTEAAIYCAMIDEVLKCTR